MKSRFDVSTEIFSGGVSLSEGYRIYEEEYKQLGFTLDKDEETVFKEVDLPITLSVGDMVAIKGLGIRMVESKYYDLDDNIMTYMLTDDY